MKDISDIKEKFGPIQLNIYYPKLGADAPRDSDYDVGYIWRYFFRQSNDRNSLIYEIDESEYDTIKDYFMYKTIRIKWKIIGNKETAESINKKIISVSNKSMPGIDKILNRNVLLYWKDIPEKITDFDVTSKLPKVMIKKKVIMSN